MTKGDILKAIVVLADGSDTKLKKETMEMWVNDLYPYSTEILTRTFERCRKELTGRLSLGFIFKILEEENTPKPPCHRLFADENTKALPASIPPQQSAALARVALKSIGKGWTREQIEDSIADTVIERGECGELDDE